MTDPATTDAAVPVPGPFTPAQAADIAEITQRIFFYGWCIDHRRFDDLDQLFLPDSIIDYAVPGGTALPWSEMKGWLPGGLSIFRCTQHNMANPLIELDGDRARSQTYGHLAHIQELEDGTVSLMTHHTIYRDRWERHGDGWRIRERVLSNLYIDGDIHREGVRTYTEPRPL